MTEISHSKGSRKDCVAALLARHWKSVRAYTSLCAAGAASESRLQTCAAQSFLAEVIHYAHPPVVRPHLLRAVRVAAEAGVDGDDVVLDAALHDAIRSRRSGIQPDRRLAERAFRALPAVTQTLLWHLHVEREDIATVAVLIGLPEVTAAAEAARSRGLLLQRCLEIHAEEAPYPECSRYSRLLLASLNRPVSGDVNTHISRCWHCRTAVQQFDHSDTMLPSLLAQAVLGWGAQDYLRVRWSVRPAPAAAARGRHRPPEAATRGRHRR
ncbi:hypothetical protein [Streptomyces sp. NPDC048191]|uniref:hypothetical protein n=1 Tax=Streptomyces sp. NPDC048191 TaxID=3155484 RepID=UPI0034060C10